MATTHYLSCAHCPSPLLSCPLPHIYICNPTSVSLVGFECLCSLEQKMERRGGSVRLCILALYISCLVVSSSHHCDAKRAMRTPRGSKHRRSLIKKLNALKRLDGDVSMLDSRKTNTQPYGVSSPFSLPPFDSLGPIPLPEMAPPFCIYPPPSTPQPPSTSVPTPVGITPPFYFPPVVPIQGPPPSPIAVVPGPPEFVPTPNPPETFPGPNPNPPEIFPSPNPNPPEAVPSPIIIIPGPPEFTPSPPSVNPPYYEPSPPSYEPSPGTPGGFVPSPPHYVPTPRGPGGSVPTPPIFQPPVVFPPPTVPPPPYKGPNYPLWCVAKPSVPDPIIEEAMNYACGSGADCASIQPSGSCFQPDTLFAHASYAFNSYWQRTKVAGGTCEFGGTAMLVTVDPSYDGCHFIYF